MTTLSEPSIASEVWPPARWLRVVAAVSTAGTRVCFLLLAWWVLVSPAPAYWAGVIIGGQLLAYALAAPAGARLVERVGAPWASLGTDLASVLALAGCAFAHAAPVSLLVGAVALGAVRAASDRSKDVLLGQPWPVPAPNPQSAPPRRGLRGTTLFVAGGAGGVATALLGSTGALWLTALAFAFCATVVVLRLPAPAATTTVAEPTTVGATAVEGTTVTLAPVTAGPATGLAGGMREAFDCLWQDRTLRRLAIVALAANLLGQAGAVVLVTAWQRALLG